jgi:hypothetical protein
MMSVSQCLARHKREFERSAAAADARRIKS